MPFSTSEIKRIRHELGQNLLEVGADSYISIHQGLEVVVQTYVADEIATTSTSTITGAADPAPGQITLADATGFAAGDRIVVDVDSRREIVTTQALSGATLTALFTKDHGGGGGYPVSVEGPIPIVKDILAKIAKVKEELASTFGEGALKKVDELEFYDTNSTLFGSTGDTLMFWRDELSSALGVANLWRRKPGAGGGTKLSLY